MCRAREAVHIDREEKKNMRKDIEQASMMYSTFSFYWHFTFFDASH